MQSGPFAAVFRPSFETCKSNKMDRLGWDNQQELARDTVNDTEITCLTEKNNMGAQ